jgi:hypothetical protein
VVGIVDQYPFKTAGPKSSSPIYVNMADIGSLGYLDQTGVGVHG